MKTQTILAALGCALVSFAPSIASAQAPDSAYCRSEITDTEQVTGDFAAEINSEGDLLVLLDANGDGTPERALHGAPAQGQDLERLVAEINAVDESAFLQLLYRHEVAASGFDILDEDNNPLLSVHTGNSDCYPEVDARLWLNGLAHYSLSNFQPLAHWTVDRLRGRSLIQRRATSD